MGREARLPATADAGTDASAAVCIQRQGYDVWGFPGSVPILGTLIHGPQALYNAGAAAIDLGFGDPHAARDHATDAGIHAVESIPFLGSLVSAVQLIGDHMPDSRSGELGGGFGEHGNESMYYVVESYLFGEEESYTRTEEITDEVPWLRGTGLEEALGIGEEEP